MSSWGPWTDEAFARAKAQDKPLLAAAGARPPKLAREVSQSVARRFVAVLADPDSRPDAAARVGAGHLVVMDPDGVRRGVLPISSADLGAALERMADEASFASSGRPEDPAPAWSAAVPPKSLGSAPDETCLEEAFAEARSAAAAGGVAVEVLEALAYAVSERNDARALPLLEQGVDALLSGPLWDAANGAFRALGESPLRANARRVRLLWDVHALTGADRWRRSVEAATRYLLHALYDPRLGSFLSAPAPKSPVHTADGNAQAVLALLRASAFDVPGAPQAAGKALSFLQGLYDPILGLRHSAGGGGEEVCGLLGDAAWSALAFTEAFQATGDKAHREFADVLLRFLFQELWERDNGGFLDRVPRASDPAILRETRLDPGLNAVALEVCWRLHHLKGNANYRRWLDWALRGLWSLCGADAAGRAGLARVADMAARGRLDLELVGRPGETLSAALLAAARRAYAPRAIVSFVDPDDQGYIMAHKLTADSYPRLFGCGTDLRRLSDSAEPSGVAAVLCAMRAAEGV
ncbi:MAG: hypothetical protein A2X40_01155 [Elusimicrobia bacterium GWC2_65_9]|nr:MAG: hypothetical protein A2X37_10730 [Elusimicrobia bacterium GWA2_66_18]OGR77244.1 MAG: hypothetical protein A2X40_01155 [Elusimicrobia bacterium GWC2_65_9]